jgi:hypothetical protein
MRGLIACVVPVVAVMMIANVYNPNPIPISNSVWPMSVPPQGTYPVYQSENEIAVITYVRYYYFNILPSTQLI